MIETVINKLRIVSGMMDINHVSIILNQLKLIIDNNIPGDVVELGCNVGTTAIYIKSFLNAQQSNKKYHVYDSFEGLPEKSDHDISWAEGATFEKGGCPSTVDQFIYHFNEFDLDLPSINIGWFKEIPAKQYPETISFAFFDGDFYSSIMDSWEIIYPKLSKGAIVCIHDYDYDILPGVRKACDDFLEDKPEKGMIVFSNYIGIFTKL
jgi:O-methyltransferase